MKILVSDNLEQSCIDILVREGFTVDNRPGLPQADLETTINDYDALVVRSATKVTADIISRAGNLKVIGRAGTGVDNIDVAAATRRGILVMNTPGGNTISAAEHTVSLLLAMARNIPQANMSMARGEWERKKFTGTEVYEKTLGVVGFGKIGKEVALRCQGFGMQVVVYDPVVAKDVTGKLNMELVNLEDLFRRADFITVHTPLTEATRGLLNDATFAKCKKGVRVVNCARGGIIDEGALHRALESGQVAGAALDVFEKEPPLNSPLLGHPRVVVTPHLGASTEEAQEKVAIQIAHQLADALHGRAYAGVVNGGAMHLTLKEEVRPFVSLAEKLGQLVVQLADGKVRSVTIGASGDVVLASMELLKAGVLKGILSQTQQEPVNIISAPVLAKEMGLSIVESRETAGGNYPNILRVRYQTDRDNRECAGTVFGSSSVRLVMIDGLRFEVRPEGDLLIYYNIDRPGMLAHVGTVLARHEVNIAGVSLGRTATGGNALTVMNIDGAIPPAALNELAKLDGISRLKTVRLE